MPTIPLIMPQLGESIAEATTTSYLVQPGQQVAADQDIIEVETSKATMNVTSPCSGRLESFHAKVGESYPVGATLGHLDASKEDAARLGLDVEEPPPEEKITETAAAPSHTQTDGARTRVQPTVRGLPEAAVSLIFSSG